MNTNSKLTEEQLKYKKLYEEKQKLMKEATEEYNVVQKRADELEAYLNKVENQSTTNITEQQDILQVEPEGQTTAEREQELTEETRVVINERYSDEQRIKKNFVDGYTFDKSLERGSPPRKLEIDEMNSTQLLSEGYRRLAESKQSTE